jgi:hypothetical protein
MRARRGKRMHLWMWRVRRVGYGRNALRPRRVLADAVCWLEGACVSTAPYAASCLCGSQRDAKNLPSQYDEKASKFGYGIGFTGFASLRRCLSLTPHGARGFGNVGSLAQTQTVPMVPYGNIASGDTASGDAASGDASSGDAVSGDTASGGTLGDAPSSALRFFSRFTLTLTFSLHVHPRPRPKMYPFPPPFPLPLPHTLMLTSPLCTHLQHVAGTWPLTPWHPTLMPRGTYELRQHRSKDMRVSDIVKEQRLLRRASEDPLRRRHTCSRASIDVDPTTPHAATPHPTTPLPRIPPRFPPPGMLPPRILPPHMPPRILPPRMPPCMLRHPTCCHRLETDSARGDGRMAEEACEKLGEKVADGVTAGGGGAEAGGVRDGAATGARAMAAAETTAEERGGAERSSIIDG